MQFIEDSVESEGGGVAFCITSFIKHYLLPEIKTKVVHSLVLKLEDSEISITAAYFPDSKMNVQKYSFYESDSRVIANLKGKNVICGDLNSLWKCNRSNKVGNSF